MLGAGGGLGSLHDPAGFLLYAERSPSGPHTHTHSLNAKSDFVSRKTDSLTTWVSRWYVIHERLECMPDSVHLSPASFSSSDNPHHFLYIADYSGRPLTLNQVLKL